MSIAYLLSLENVILGRWIMVVIRLLIKLIMSKIKIAGIAGIAGAMLAGSLVLAQSANLAVSCSGNVANNVVTWVAGPTGGIPPYGYVWSGTNISGTATSTVVTYNATGTYTATVTVHDTTTSTASATCSATVNSLPVTTPTSTPTSTPKVMPPMLNINPGGHFMARGMTVTSVASGSFQAQVWGITYTINWSGNVVGKGPEFLFRFNDANSTSTIANQLKVGDEVGVSGKIDPASPFIVSADVVRDYSIVMARKSDDNDNEHGKDHGNGNSSSSNNGSSSDEIRGRLNDLLNQLQGLRNLFNGQGKGNGNGQGGDH